MRVEPVTASKVSRFLDGIDTTKQVMKYANDMEVFTMLGRASLEFQLVKATQLLREIASTPATPENLAPEPGKFIVDEADVKRIAVHLSAAHLLSAHALAASEEISASTAEEYLEHHKQVAKLLGEIIGKEMPNEAL